MEEDGHGIHLSDSAADIVIVEQALRISAAGHKTVVVSDDTDVLTLLIHYCDVQDLLHESTLGLGMIDMISCFNGSF